MVTAKITSKGQVTVPRRVRDLLGAASGDLLVFDTGPDGAVTLRAVKQQSLTSLLGALPPTRPYPGKETVREEVGRDLGRNETGE